MTRYNFSLISGALHIAPIHGLSDLTSLRLAAQVGIGVSAPFVLWGLTSVAFGQPGAGLITGTAFGTMLLMRTAAEAGQVDSEHRIKIDHARELSRMEIKERDAAIPKKQRPSRQPSVRPAIASPVPDPEAEGESSLAADVRLIFETGIKQGSFARNSFIKTGQPRLKLPSGDELTRPRYELIVRALLDDGLLVKGLDGAPTLPTAWHAGRMDGGQALPDDMPIVIDSPKRIGA